MSLRYSYKEKHRRTKHRRTKHRRTKHRRTKHRRTNKRLGRGVFSRVSSLINRTIRSSRPNTYQRTKSILRDPSNKQKKNKNSKSVIFFKNITKKPKQVKLNTPENIVKEYTLGTSEREYKLNNPQIIIPTCALKNPKFPCKKNQTVFNNEQEYNEYLDLRKIKNVSTGYKSRRKHYDEINSALNSQGSQLTVSRKNRKSSTNKSENIGNQI